MHKLLFLLGAIALLGCNNPDIIEKQCREAAFMWAMARGIKKSTVQCTWESGQIANCDLVANGRRFYLLRCHATEGCALKAAHHKG
jgi:hypothetical protein